MEALPLPVLADPAPEIDPRRAWATIARSGWLILGCVLLALAAGAVAVRRMEPLYQATASIRIDARPSTIGPAAMYGMPTDNVNLVATAMEELTSRSLASDVADSLGLRLQLVAPRRTPRSAVIQWARVEAGAPLRSYSFVPASNNRVTVRELSGKTIGTFPIASAITLPGASLQLDADTRWPTATSRSSSRRSSRRRRSCGRARR